MNSEIEELKFSSVKLSVMVLWFAIGDNSINRDDGGLLQDKKGRKKIISKVTDRVDRVASSRGTGIY